jgi:putative sterol carrier protein
VPPFLSDAWLAAMDAAAKADGELREQAAEAELVVQQVVTGAGPDGGEVAYAVVLTAEEVAVRPGRVDEPTVTFTQSLATAEAVANGECSAQQAFIDGDLRVGGDLVALAARHRALTKLGDVFAAARG